MYTNHSTASHRAAPRPHHRVIEPDVLETWDLQELELLLWPDAPDHVPERFSEQGWAELLNVC